MKELVHIARNEALTDSRLVAKYFHKRHKDVIVDIRNLVAVLTDTKIHFKESVYIYRGKEFPLFYINRRAFMVLVMEFRGAKAREWKLKFIDEFERMENIIRERDTDSYKVARAYGKADHRLFTDTIKELVGYAIAQGSKHSQLFYCNYSRLANTAAGIPNIDEANIWQLYQIHLAEDIIARTIMNGMRAGIYYKVIYRDCKARIAQFKAVAFIGIDAENRRLSA